MVFLEAHIELRFADHSDGETRTVASWRIALRSRRAAGPNHLRRQEKAQLFPEVGNLENSPQFRQFVAVQAGQLGNQRGEQASLKRQMTL